MAIKCNLGIFADVLSTCDTVGNGGNNTKAWLFNRLDATFTYDETYPNLITGIANADNTRAYTLTGILKTIDSGFDKIIEAGLPGRFQHFISFNNYQFDAANGLNLDNLQDLVVVVESRDKTNTGDGVFRAYGVKYGLYVSGDTHRANTAKGVRVLELSTAPDDVEPYSYYTFLDTDYATTKAALEALESFNIPAAYEIPALYDSFAGVSLDTDIWSTSTFAAGITQDDGLQIDRSAVTTGLMYGPQISVDDIHTFSVKITSSLTKPSNGDGWAININYAGSVSSQYVNGIFIQWAYSSVPTEGQIRLLRFKDSSQSFQYVTPNGDISTGLRLKVLVNTTEDTCTFYEWYDGQWVQLGATVTAPTIANDPYIVLTKVGSEQNAVVDVLQDMWVYNGDVTEETINERQPLLIIMDGQSNNGGYGLISELESSLRGIISPNIKVWKGSAISVLEMGVNNDGDFPNKTSLQCGMEPELMDRLRAQWPSRQIFLIKTGMNGTALYDFSSDSEYTHAPNPSVAAYSLHQRLLDQTSAFLTEMGLHLGNFCVWYCWDQGESDCRWDHLEAYPYYEANFINKLDYVISDLGAHKLNVYTRALSTGQTARAAEGLNVVRQAQIDVMTSYAGAGSLYKGYVLSDTWPISTADYVHLTTAGQVLKGDAFADAIIANSDIIF